MLLTKLKDLKEMFWQSELLIKEKPQFCGIKKLASQFIKQLFGKIVDRKNFVKNLRKQNKETLIFNRTGLLIDSYFSELRLNGY